MSVLWVLPITIGALGVLVIAIRARALAGEIYDSVVAFDELRLALRPATARVRSDVDLTREAFSGMRADWRTVIRR